MREGSPEADLVAYLGRLALVSSTRVEGSEHRTAAGSLVEYQVRLLLIFRRHDAIRHLSAFSQSLFSCSRLFSSSLAFFSRATLSSKRALSRARNVVQDRASLLRGRAVKLASTV